MPLPICHVVDADGNFREQVAQALHRMPAHTIGHPDALSFLSWMQEHRCEPPSCVFLEVALPGLSGLEVNRRLVSERSPPVVLCASQAYGAETIVQAIKDGAYDFREKPLGPREIAAIALSALDEHARRSEQEPSGVSAAACLERLTHREQEIARLVARGLSSKQVAHELSISKRTVDQHRSHLLRKLEVQSTAEMVALLVRAGAV